MCSRKIESVFDNHGLKHKCIIDNVFLLCHGVLPQWRWEKTGIDECTNGISRLEDPRSRRPAANQGALGYYPVRRRSAFGLARSADNQMGTHRRPKG